MCIDNLQKYNLTKNYIEGLKNKGKSSLQCQEGSDSKKQINIQIPSLNELPFKLPPNLFHIEKILRSAISEDLISNAIIHGSFGDNTTTNYSDVEITLIINEKIFFDDEYHRKYISWLRGRLFRSIIKLDPLQHHGVFYLWEELINNYDENILPLSCYDNCWAINKVNINFNVLKNDLREKSNEKLHLTLNALKNYNKYFFYDGINPYSVKRLLSNIALVPAFYYQSHGEMISKKDAINRFKFSKSEVIQKLFHEITELRSEWPATPYFYNRIRRLQYFKCIPNGRTDRILIRVYNDKAIENKTKQKVLPLLKPFVNSFYIN